LTYLFFRSYGGSKAATILVPKVHINEKINIRTEKKTLKPMLSGPYLMINQLIKSM
jgi:hypothetical protein